MRKREKKSKTKMVPVTGKVHPRVGQQKGLLETELKKKALSLSPTGQYPRWVYKQGGV